VLDPANLEPYIHDNLTIQALLCVLHVLWLASSLAVQCVAPILGAKLQFEHIHGRRSYLQFEYMEDVLRGGQLPPEALQRCPAVTDVFADDGDRAAAFARGMTGATLGRPCRIMLSVWHHTQVLQANRMLPMS
jgi:hypothetical protein